MLDDGWRPVTAQKIVTEAVKNMPFPQIDSDPTLRYCKWKNCTFYLWDELYDDYGFYAYVNVYIPIGEHVRGADLDVRITTNKLFIRQKSTNETILDGDLYRGVRPDEGYWEIENKQAMRVIRIVLLKIDKHWFWERVIEGEYNIKDQAQLPKETTWTNENLMRSKRQFPGKDVAEDWFLT
mmetsp:Transcript_10580/g.19315  ORF Transcript_10580/g.19315 Transcript_10580/m.19315 type:complete len:181 (-) Transcript_10580:192-734(-)